MPKPPRAHLTQKPKATPWVYLRSTLQWAILLPNIVLHMLIAMMSIAFFPRILEPILRSLAHTACFLAGLRIRIHGREETRPPGTCIVLFNHTNIFDFFASYVILPFKARGIEKEAHFHWPLYGRFLRAVGQVPIAPVGNTRAALASLERAKELFHAGYSVGIAPEGTRSPDGNLGPFKKGAFHMAVQLQADLWPVVYVGMYDFNQKGSLLLYPRYVDVYFEPCISTQGLTPSDVGDLRDQTREVFVKRLSGLS